MTEIKLNIGCGEDYKDGYVNIDGNEALPKVDKIINFDHESLTDHYQDSSLDHILANDFIEHHFHWQAKQILSSGLQIPGFRKDERIIQKVLERYITPLTIMGGIGIGLLASTANIFTALTSGTGSLLLIMIIYQFYKQLARESMEDFSLLKKFMRR